MKYHRRCYRISTALKIALAQTGTVGHDVAAGGAGEAGQGPGNRVRGRGDHRGRGQPVQKELTVALPCF